MSKYALVIFDEEEVRVVDQVANNDDELVNVELAVCYAMANKYKVYELLRWVKENRPNWKIYEAYFELTAINIAGGKIGFKPVTS